ncbi:LysM peptidoglycan-binding domain-containing protein [Planomicrobium okeanokoites]|uniref:LysM peptidoglycan-binding domain-containing protein n=1 Tax=Planomicrobium okeanokoites TaxID=244 RepID=UPI002490A4BE|nr:LysM peptidoglycan-binding domain-containing protein [Planomicrobium okeanokoites]
MDKKNYRESLEKDRQEIITDSNSTLSRRAHRQTGSQKTQKRKNLLLPALFFIFILIPVTILIYVAFVYEPNDTLIGAENENEVSFENTASPEENSVLVPEETEEDVADETEEAADEKSEETDAAAEEKKDDTVKEDTSEETEEPAESETPAEQETPAAETPSTPEPEEPADSDAAGAKTVIVKDNETLYRIAVNNYGASGAGAAVEKIKQANGLSSNEIYAGQKLILP